MKKLLLVAAIVLGPCAIADAKDASIAIAGLTAGYAAGLICNASVNNGVAAAYLREGLNSEDVSLEALNLGLIAAAVLVTREVDIPCEDLMKLYGPNGTVIPGLLSTP